MQVPALIKCVHASPASSFSDQRSAAASQSCQLCSTWMWSCICLGLYSRWAHMLLFSNPQIRMKFLQPCVIYKHPPDFWSICMWHACFPCSWQTQKLELSRKNPKQISRPSVGKSLFRFGLLYFGGEKNMLETDLKQWMTPGFVTTASQL